MLLIPLRHTIYFVGKLFFTPSHENVDLWEGRVCTFCLPLFLQHLILCLAQRRFIIHFVVCMDLVNGLRLDSIEPADELEEAVKGAVRDGSQSAGLGTGEKLCQLRTERLGRGQIGNRDGGDQKFCAVHITSGVWISYLLLH